MPPRIVYSGCFVENRNVHEEPDRILHMEDAAPCAYHLGVNVKVLTVQLRTADVGNGYIDILEDAVQDVYPCIDVET